VNNINEHSLFAQRQMLDKEKRQCGGPHSILTVSQVKGEGRKAKAEASINRLRHSQMAPHNGIYIIMFI
jgi:hypothetical protein